MVTNNEDEDDGFDWSDYEHGRVVRHLCEALHSLYIVAPDNEADPLRIADWHSLTSSLVFDLEQACWFCDWERGGLEARHLGRHLDEAPTTDDDNTPQWWELLRIFCKGIEDAAQERWPEPPPDEDD